MLINERLYKMARTNQGGSVLGFVLIGGVMALLLIGGAYLVRYYYTPDTDRGPVAVEDAGDDGSSEEIETETDEPTTEEDETTPEEETQPEQDETTEPDQDEESEVSGEPDMGTFTPEEPDNGEGQPRAETDSDSSPENLPETGLGSTLLTTLIIGGVVGSAVAYRRSRGASVSL